MNKDSSAPVIYRIPSIYFTHLRIFSLSSGLTSLSNAHEAETLS